MKVGIMARRKLIVIESPYAGNIEQYTQYLRRAMRHSIGLGEAPLASHALYALSGVLNDNDTEERELGISIGLQWARATSVTAVYEDYGISLGMRQGIHAANKAHRPIVYRRIGT